ncbi:MAG: metal-dependent transcriptional regulator [Acholeplasmatales bacterium]|nr:metal-dependent transcriptional regulator [Acholeplasmatales bacterium]
MSVLESGENYLEAILMLSKEKDGVHAIDIVNDLGFSKPSVSIMLKKLKDEGYIEIDNNQHIHLLPEGLKIAEKILERHETLTEILTYLGVDPEIAEDDACKIEHDLSDVTFAQIKKYYLDKIKNH